MSEASLQKGRAREATPAHDKPFPDLPAAKIEIRHLDFYYNKRQALKDINLTIPDRRITAVQAVSAKAQQALHTWIVANKLHFDHVEYRRAGATKQSAPTSLDPAAYSAADSGNLRPSGS
jgi:hypothetical protein